MARDGKRYYSSVSEWVRDHAEDNPPVSSVSEWVLNRFVQARQIYDETSPDAPERVAAESQVKFHLELLQLIQAPSVVLEPIDAESTEAVHDQAG